MQLLQAQSRSQIVYLDDLWAQWHCSSV